MVIKKELGLDQEYYLPIAHVTQTSMQKNR